MDLFHKIMALVDKNSGNIPEGDYLELCDTIHALREHVKPPSFLDQSIPMLVSDHDPERDGPLIYEPTNTQLSHDEEVMYPGLNQFLQELHEEWTEHVEPGSYYPPTRQSTDID
tara:strand:+ start:296 stop:637 length:342 start_codon:yes stop_codon:yes gene_type:complete